MEIMKACKSLGSLVQLALVWHSEDIYFKPSGQLVSVTCLYLNFPVWKLEEKALTILLKWKSTDYPSKVVLRFTIKKMLHET